jgi:lycopene beta-cyclase
MVHPMDPTSGQSYSKIAIVGGGLSGCLTLHAIRAHFPKAHVTLFEKQRQLCGNHTWCLYDTDIPAGCSGWFRPLIDHSWPHYEVDFPEYSRELIYVYHCLRAANLREKTLLLASQGNVTLHMEAKCQIRGLKCVEVSGEARDFDLVIDCRGWSALPQQCGFQKFLGLEVEFKKPHGQLYPKIMDATVDQIDGYRFVYTLPLTATQMLVEDTYYSNGPSIDRVVVQRRLEQYCEQRGWKIDRILYQEIGSLPIPLERGKRELQTVSLGAGALRFHAVTGYSLPWLLKDLDQILASLSQGQTANEILTLQKASWKQNSGRELFYLSLNRMFFWGAMPEQRYRILQRFYKFDPELIQRFYAGHTRRRDMVRILAGRPPLSIFAALKALVGFQRRQP